LYAALARRRIVFDIKVCMQLRTWIFAVAVAGTAHLLEPAHVSARQAPATVSAPKIIEVVARRFEFEPSTIEITEGDHVRLVIKSDDGVHGVEIKKFKVNKLIPRGGKPITIDFVATSAGTFPIMCSEECGEGHEDMSGSLVVRAKAK
jgi:cytochrome c oxidase subunit 2